MKTDFTNFNKCPIDSHVQHPFVSKKKDAGDESLS